MTMNHWLTSANAVKWLSILEYVCNNFDISWQISLTSGLFYEQYIFFFFQKIKENHDLIQNSITKVYFY